MRPWIRFLSYGLGGFCLVFAIVSAAFRDFEIAITLASIGMVWIVAAWRYRRYDP
jgi:hypothetical protein